MPDKRIRPDHQTATRCCPLMRGARVLAHSAAAEAPRPKGQLTGVAGAGIDSIVRAEGWVKHTTSHLDLKLKFEQRDGSHLRKYRIQFLPLGLGNTATGRSTRIVR
jgi:hypothetical protein